MNTPDSTKNYNRLLKRRSKGLRTLFINGWFTKILVYITFITTPLLIFMGLIYSSAYQKNIVNITFHVISLFGFAAIVINLVRKWKKIRAPIGSNHLFLPAPNNITMNIKSLISEICAKLNVSPDRLSIFIARRVYHGSPSMTCDSAGYKLIVPLGFTKVMANNPHIARAMLEHEVAHVEQNDIELWSFANFFTEISTRIILPLYALILLAMLAISLYQYNHTFKETLVEHDMITKQEIQQDINQKIIQHQYSISDHVSIQRNNQSTDNISADMSNATKTNNLTYKYYLDYIIFIIIYLIASAFALMTVLAPLSSIRYFRRLSEALADLAVVLHSDGFALVQAIEQYEEPNWKWHFFPIHPSPRWRKKRIIKAMEKIYRPFQKVV